MQQKIYLFSVLIYDNHHLTAQTSLNGMGVMLFWHLYGEFDNVFNAD